MYGTTWRPPVYSRSDRRLLQTMRGLTMRLSKALVEKFQALHLKKWGIPISYNAAEADLKELAELVRIVSKIGGNKVNAQAIHS